MFLKAFLAAAALAAVGIGGIYLTVPDQTPYLPATCQQAAVPQTPAATPVACDGEGGDCCEAMLAATRAQKIVAGQPKPEAAKRPEVEQK